MKKPKATAAAQPAEVTADVARALLNITTREGVIYMIKAGKLPGSHKLEEKRTSPWLIPVASIEAYVAEKNLAEKKRAQAVKA